MEIFTVNVQAFIWKSFESNHKRMTTFSQFNWRTFVDKAMVNFYCCLLFCPTVSWSPCICALGTLVVIMFWFVSIIVETIEITSESMEMAFSGLMLSFTRLKFTILDPSVFTHFFFLLGQIHFCYNVHTYLCTTFVWIVEVLKSSSTRKKTWLFIVMYPMRVSCFKLSNSADSKHQRENRLGIQQPAGSPNSPKKLAVSVLSLQFVPLIIP